jgi:hypothetical protein
MQDAMWRRMREMGYGGTPPIVRSPATPNFGSQAPAGAAAPRSRRTGGADPAAVALALSGFSLYWTLPALAANGKRRRRKKRRTNIQPPREG